MGNDPIRSRRNRVPTGKIFFALIARLEGATPKKVIVVPKRIVNVVV